MKENNAKIKRSQSIFERFCSSVQDLLGIEDSIVSDLHSASVDSSGSSPTYIYNETRIDTEIVKLDDITQKLQEYMRETRRCPFFEQPEAVDAVCVNQKNEWLLIEFKNAPIRKKKSKEKKNDTRKKKDDEGDLNSEVITSIRHKMQSSLWILFTMNSFSNGNLYGDDVTEFARNHVTYIVVVSREKNTEEYHRICQSYKRLYTPNYFRKYVGYMFKDVYLFTEQELASYIKKYITD